MSSGKMSSPSVAALMRSILLMGSEARYPNSRGSQVFESGFRNMESDPLFADPRPAAMPCPSLLCLRGRLVGVRKTPDGDSIRFEPDTPDLVGRLRFGSRVDFSSDGTVQLRLDGIDAPESHYNRH